MSQPSPASPLYWRYNDDVFRLIGVKCKDCGFISHPRTKICHDCGSTNVEEYELSKRGTVETYCVNWAPPAPFEPPILPVIVELEGGGKYGGQMTECNSPDDIKIGTKVDLVFRKVMTDRGLNVYGFKLRLAEEG